MRVEGILNARWLLRRLSDSFVFKSCEPMHDDVAGSCSSFHVRYNSHMPRSAFEKLLAAIPEVNLMLEPA